LNSRRISSKSLQQKTEKHKPLNELTLPAKEYWERIPFRFYGELVAPEDPLLNEYMDASDYVERLPPLKDFREKVLGKPKALEVKAAEAIPEIPQPAEVPTPETPIVSPVVIPTQPTLVTPAPEQVITPEEAARLEAARLEAAKAAKEKTDKAQAMLPQFAEEVRLLGDLQQEVSRLAPVVEQTSPKKVAVVSDIHGAYGRLKQLLTSTNVITDTGEPNVDKIIFLGDYIDRGQQSLATIDYVAGLTAQGKAVMLLGNHEFMFMGAMQGDISLLWNWLYNGGDLVLEEANVDLNWINYFRQLIQNKILGGLTQEERTNLNNFIKVIQQNQKLLRAYNLLKTNGKLHHVENEVLYVHGGVPIEPSNGQMSLSYRHSDGNTYDGLAAMQAMEDDIKRDAFNYGQYAGGWHSPVFAGDPKRKAGEWFNKVQQYGTIDTILTQLGVKKIIHGHTSIKLGEGNAPYNYFNGNVLGIDLGMTERYGGRGGVLILDNAEGSEGDAVFNAFVDADATAATTTFGVEKFVDYSQYQAMKNQLDISKKQLVQQTQKVEELLKEILMLEPSMAGVIAGNRPELMKILTDGGININELAKPTIGQLIQQALSDAKYKAAEMPIAAGLDSLNKAVDDYNKEQTQAKLDVVRSRLKSSVVDRVKSSTDLLKIINSLNGKVPSQVIDSLNSQHSEMAKIENEMKAVHKIQKIDFSNKNWLIL